MIKRIAKMLAALGTGMGLALVVQLLLPPAFLHYYGIRRYGEWLVLSATVSYLSTLNFGVTTYASNQLTMLRKRGELDEYRRLQGSTLAMILSMLCAGLIIISSVFFLPLTTLLHLSTFSRNEANLTAFFLGLLAMSNIFAGYYNNLFMVLEKAHRGLTWGMARFGISALICVPLAMLRVPFSVIAISQFSASMLIATLTVFDLKSKMGSVPLGLKGANWKTAKASLAPSGMFAMIFTQQFLLFQAPVILLNWLLGPEVVVLFTICRTIFSAARQMLQTITYAIAPEVTFSFADSDMKKLLNIFHYSEKVVFSVIPVVNLGAFLASPILLSLWLHKPQLFDPYVYGLMSLISGAMSMRDHKQFFQFSTNMHKRLSIIVFFGNIVMIAGSIPLTVKFGLYGFMFTWLASEVLQMGLIYHENKKLFHNDPSINFMPVVKLWLVMALSLPVCLGMVHFGQRISLAMVGVVAVAGVMMLIVEAYFVFGVRDVLDLLQKKLRGKATEFSTDC